ncbi:AAA family ATPase [Pseudomonas caspiana]|nr:ATP-binding protein [Pseudomonas caspiana]TPG96514.1 AAA family ATPase [Pseudomonas caspiana]
MARSDLVIKLAQASLDNDKQLVRRTIEAIITEEHSRQHHIYAQKLTDALRSERWTKQAAPESHKPNNIELNSSNKTNPEELFIEIKPKRSLSQIFLDEQSQELCNELIDEHLRADLLRSFAVEPRNRLLLVGPPGNGKTSLAEAIAYSMGLPLYVVKYESVIGSYLGETALRLKQVFDFLKTRPCVVFFDEFDAIGKERGDTHETGEIKRVVSSLLLQIDDLPSYNIVIAATNHPELIDRAAWRRFQVKIELNPPTSKQIQLFISSFESNLGESLDYSHSELAKKLTGNSYSTIENFFLDIKRKLILSTGNSKTKDIISKQLNQLSPAKHNKEDISNHGKTTSDRSKPTNKTIKSERQSEIF